jgi:hypothetical protein
MNPAPNQAIPLMNTDPRDWTHDYTQPKPLMRSDLIKRLEEINASEGDGPVCLSNYMEENTEAQITTVARIDGRVVLESEDGK